MTKQILEDIRIIDLSRGVAGAVASMMLAESGADVVKVEPPGGDPTRALPGFSVWNRSKRGIVLDLTSKSGQEKLNRLLAEADIIVHDCGPKAAREIGIDDAGLMARYPQLIICSIPAFPVPHPDADRPANDVLVLARAGLMDEQKAVRRDGPIYLRVPLCSIGAWHLAAAGIVARLIARERDGVGGLAHTSLFQGALVPMTMHWARAETPTPSFARGMAKHLTSPLFECADGKWMHIMAAPDKAPLMQQVFAEMGEEAVKKANADYLATAVGQNYPYPNYGANEKAFKRRPRQEWLESLWASDVPVQPCLALGEVYFDEQANINNYVIDVEDPALGKTRQPGHPYATDPAPRLKSAAPRLGQHTDEVFAEPRRMKARQRGKSSGRPPLDGVKVLDFGNFLAGPLAPMFMADLGAEVIKVEAHTGDQMRNTVERVFSGCQRGKRDLAINLKAPEARAVIGKLLQWADVVHHNIRYPAAKRLGIDHDSFIKIKPDIIYCHTSSYGPKGPRADWPGYDQLFQAASGWEYEGAGQGNKPMWHRFGMMDHQNALASLVATLLAIYHKRRSGKGQFCAASLLGASILTISETIIGPEGKLMPYERLDADQLGVSPFKRIYQCADRKWIAVVAESAAQQAALLKVTGATSAADLEDRVAKFGQEGLVSDLEKAGVGVEPVRLDQQDAFLDSADSAQADLVARYRHATWGEVMQIGSLWNLGDLPLRFSYASPELGEHSRQIMQEIGISDATAAELIDKGLVVQFGEKSKSAAAE